MDDTPGFPEEHLRALGAHLRASGIEIRLLVVGGAALRMRNVVPRSTDDVDVLAMIGAHDQPTRPDIGILKPFILRVARDFGIPEDWLNTEVAMQWKGGMPPNQLDDVEWRHFDALQIGLAGRPLMIALKLFATADQSRDSVHCQDLIALAPGDSELLTAREWVLTQDGSAHWPSFVDDVIKHVQAHRLP